MPPPDFCTARFSGGLVEIHSSVKLVDTSYSSGNTDGCSWSNKKILYCQINNVWMDTVSALLWLSLSPLPAAMWWGSTGRCFPRSSAWLGRGVFSLNQNFVSYLAQLLHPTTSFRILWAALSLSLPQTWSLLLPCLCPLQPLRDCHHPMACKATGAPGAGRVGLVTASTQCFRDTQGGWTGTNHLQREQQGGLCAVA